MKTINDENVAERSKSFSQFDFPELICYASMGVNTARELPKRLAERFHGV